MLLLQGKIDVFCNEIKLDYVRISSSNLAQVNNESEQCWSSFEQKHIFDGKEERC